MQRKFIIGTLVLLILGLTVYFVTDFNGTNKKESTTYVNLMINPNIELELDQNDKVLDVSALNEEAEIVLYDMDLINKSYEEAIDVLIDELVELGYIIDGDFENRIIISVVDEDDSKRERLEERTLNRVRENLESKEVYAVINYLDIGTELSKEAEELGISVGHMITIERASAMLENYDKEELLEMSIREIKSLVKEEIVNERTNDLNIEEQRQRLKQEARNRVNVQTSEIETPRKPTVQRREVSDLEPSDRGIRSRPEREIPPVREHNNEASDEVEQDIDILPEQRGR